MVVVQLPYQLCASWDTYIFISNPGLLGFSVVTFLTSKVAVGWRETPTILCWGGWGIKFTLITDENKN